MKIKKENLITLNEDLLLDTEEPKFSKQFIEQLSLIFFDEDTE